MVARSAWSGGGWWHHRGSSAPFTARLAPGHIERRLRRIDTDDLDPTIGEQQREHSRPAADVEDLTRPELLSDADVRVEVAPIGIERIVDRGEPRMPEGFARHQERQSSSGIRASPEGVKEVLDEGRRVLHGVCFRGQHYVDRGCTSSSMTTTTRTP
jgi:hypothetical protein